MTDANPESSQPESQRLDKWLWFARMVKTRTLATRLVTSGKVRVNREKINKAAHCVRAGDVVTVTVNRRVRILKIMAPGSRRGPASEAQMLYDDISPVEEAPAPLKGMADFNSAPRRVIGAGRPTKKERRDLEKLRGSEN